MKTANRIRRLIDSARTRFELDLDGKFVLTEAATGHYALTAPIAAAAGAQVCALTRNSSHGSAHQAAAQTRDWAKALGISDQVTIIEDRDNPLIGDADVVTNLGFVRPLDSQFLPRLKNTAAIPLMYETWEFRSEDIDLEACRRLGIPVLGTNEHHPNLRTLEFVGLVALKLLFSMEIEVLGTRLTVLGSGEFGAICTETLTRCGAAVTHFSPGAADFDDGSCLSALADADAVVVAEHVIRKPLIAEDGPLHPQDIARTNVKVAHISGNVDRRALDEAGVTCAPVAFAPSGYMSVTTAFLGPKPLIDLHAAGLRVGSELVDARKKGLNAEEAEKAVLRSCPYAQGFGRDEVQNSPGP